MERTLLLVICALSMLGCRKDAPVLDTVSFDQEHSYSVEQPVRLPSTAGPELTVTVADLQYSICPQGMLCIAPDLVSPTLSITDATGVAQQLTLPLHQRLANAAWVDTATVRANGRSYLLYYTKWEVASNRSNVQKKDITVRLRVTKQP